MLTITEAAGEYLLNQLVEAKASELSAVRFAIKGQELVPSVDQPSDDDATIDHGGRTVLVLDEKVSKLLSDKTLDVEETEGGPRLTVHLQVNV